MIRSLITFPSLLAQHWLPGGFIFEELSHCFGKTSTSFYSTSVIYEVLSFRQKRNNSLTHTIKIIRRSFLRLTRQQILK